MQTSLALKPEACRRRVWKSWRNQALQPLHISWFGLCDLICTLHLQALQSISEAGHRGLRPRHRTPN
ncbi:hypothetical protein PGT21_015159 [Puccinia graminis f. sp. tritici]|uniref:Uncharacterized protein n=1 Tax=Puccinia graminis f. sp. tritici TaxID=56615 RepID=A0A5B0LKM3_PUCGR|nr:hypothetical protein PGT21_015159 [Puccinia graminis f. sp. tritici]